MSDKELNHQCSVDASDLCVALVNEITPQEAHNMLNAILNSDKDVNALIRLLVGSSMVCTSRLGKQPDDAELGKFTKALADTAIFFAGLKLCHERKKDS